VYVPLWPSVKLPTWVFASTRSGAPVTVVGSLAVSFDGSGSPAVEMATLFVVAGMAAGSTFTVRANVALSFGASVAA